MKKNKSDEKHEFGGSWTEEKLETIKKYLVAYATIMKKKNFKFAYVDAFAGTGYRNERPKDEENLDLFLELTDLESKGFLDGSARIALQIIPEFDHYEFVEQHRDRSIELERLKEEFPDKRARIKIQNKDANTFLIELCNKNWKSHRAVVFLDPYGMQVKWSTIQAIAETKAIDLWILFPLGSGVSRFLRKDGKINEADKQRLNELFGDTGWFDKFYTKSGQQSLFGEDEQLEKVADFKAIGNYFVKRLKTIFPHVATNPRSLYNSKNVPLFLLCFAAGNEKGGATAVKIANDILIKEI